MSGESQPQAITPDLLLRAYANGYFPMAKTRHTERLFWFRPEERAVFPLDSFHVPRSLKKFLRHCPFRITRNQAFPDVIRACADMRTDKRNDSWINDEIIALYNALAAHGFAHSVECWQEDRLVGGLYGVALGGAFFGESMFSRAENASKTALVHLVEHLRTRGFLLLDAQYANDHLHPFGLQIIPDATYQLLLAKALHVDTHF